MEYALINWILTIGSVLTSDGANGVFFITQEQFKPGICNNFGMSNGAGKGFKGGSGNNSRGNRNHHGRGKSKIGNSYGGRRAVTTLNV